MEKEFEFYTYVNLGNEIYTEKSLIFLIKKKQE